MFHRAAAAYHGVMPHRLLAFGTLFLTAFGAAASCGPLPAYALRVEVLECKADASASSLFDRPMVKVRIRQLKQRVFWFSKSRSSPGPTPDTEFLMWGPVEVCAKLSEHTQDLLVPALCCDTIPEGPECRSTLRVAQKAQPGEVDGA